MNSDAVNVEGPDGLHFVWVGKTETEGDLVHLCGDDMERIFCVPSEWVSKATEAQVKEINGKSKTLPEEVEAEEVE